MLEPKENYSPKDRAMMEIEKPDSDQTEPDAPQEGDIANEAPQVVDLRAHHLFSLQQLVFFRAHKSEFAEHLYRNLKDAQFKMMGRGDGKEFADHLIDSILQMSKSQLGEIRITNSHDLICDKCPQRGGDHCKVFGKEFSVDFLSMVDEAIIRNTNGVLELDKSYPPEYILQNIKSIRRAIRKTLLEIPRLKQESMNQKN